MCLNDKQLLLKNLDSPIHSEIMECVGLNMTSLQVGSCARFMSLCLTLFISSNVHPLLVSLSGKTPFWICFLALHSFSIIQPAGLACAVCCPGCGKVFGIFPVPPQLLGVWGMLHLMYIAPFSPFAPQLTLSWLSDITPRILFVSLATQTSQSPPFSGHSLYIKF